MGAKQIAIIIVSLIVGIYLLINALIFLVNMGNSSPEESAEDVGELIVKAAVPWWIPILAWFSSLGGIISIILVGLFIIFLKWIKEIK